MRQRQMVIIGRTVGIAMGMALVLIGVLASCSPTPAATSTPSVETLVQQQFNETAQAQTLEAAFQQALAATAAIEATAMAPIVATHQAIAAQTATQEAIVQATQQAQAIQTVTQAVILRQPALAIKGYLIAKEDGTTGNVGDVIFVVALPSGGAPVNLDDAVATKVVIIGYRDAVQFENNLDYIVDFITNVGTTNDLLEDGELAQITVDLSNLSSPLIENTAFTLEVKPPTGGILQINSTTPAMIEEVMFLR